MMNMASFKEALLCWFSIRTEMLDRSLLHFVSMMTTWERHIDKLTNTAPVRHTAVLYPPWEPSQDIPCLYGTPVHKNPSQDSVLSQRNSAHILHPVSLRYILILSSRIIHVFQVSFDQNFVLTSHRPTHATCPTPLIVMLYNRTHGCATSLCVGTLCPVCFSTRSRLARPPCYLCNDFAYSVAISVCAPSGWC
jgi:hypothetical protein